ncbi:MAG: N-acetyl-gamma-glutamyl-phosphate reductase [Candidatus Hydrogenedentes bacterium]|nr:N-acetyl-gamma-glutamyl-phosphate reductase [Candidatus Hydrogenedentota bacterium]
MIRVGVVGALGYGARELIRLLGMHPEAELVAAADLESGKRLDEVLPSFGKITDVVTEPFDAEALAGKCDVVFIAVPGTKSMAIGAALRAAKIKTIDQGPDFRLKDTAAFAKYYKTEHTAPHLLDEAVYGMAPFYREAIRKAELIAAPGCYVMSALVPLKPLADVLDPGYPVIMNAISGISGAGRAAHEAFHFPEMNENLKAYKVAVHQHTPEIEQELGNRVPVQFAPHVGPYTRGILSTITVRLTEDVDLAERYACYADEPFIRVLGEGKLAEIRNVRASNFCDFGWVIDERTGHLIIVSAIDNLCGGTAGMAVQSMNIMFGLDERCGLTYGGMAP